jgi:hypothetical protein
MLRLSVFIAFYGASAAWAHQAEPGPMLTLGAQSSGLSVYAGLHNPAVGHLMVNPQEQWRMGYAPAFSSQSEIGQVDDFVDDINDLIDIVDDASSTQDPVQTTLDRFNSLLVTMGDEGYLKNTNRIELPLMPLYWKLPQWDATLMADVHVATQFKAGLLDAPLAYDDQNNSFTTASSAYIKGALQTGFALGYSQSVLDAVMQRDYGAKLLAGAKLSIYSIALSKQVFLLQNLDGKDIDKLVEDEFDNNTQTTTAAGLDLGLVWVAEDYRLGATLFNVNQPEFNFGPVGEDCQSKTSQISRSNCEAAADFVQVRGDIKSREVHKKTAYLAVDGMYQVNPRWAVSAALDLAAYDDWVGTQNQWLHLASDYSPQTFWLPNWRLAVQKNLAGSELTQLAVGVGFASCITLDISMALDSVDIDGTSAPRSLGFSLAISEKF